MYIDNELSLDEKILFINHVYGNKTFTDDTVSMLQQEKILDAALNQQQAPETALPISFTSRPIHSIGLAMAACILLILSFLAGADFTPQSIHLTETASIPATVQHRFVILQQGSVQVEITGSFTDWQKVPLTPTGSEGYWEITMDVPYGEHRYSFIVDGTRLLPDPTVAAQEPDDFGAINSILSLES
jgi:hypothetical protein